MVNKTRERTRGKSQQACHGNSETRCYFENQAASSPLPLTLFQSIKSKSIKTINKIIILMIIIPIDCYYLTEILIMIVT